MVLTCPECRADLEVADAATAKCVAHGGSYQILFDRSMPDAAAPIPNAPAVARPPGTHGLNVPCVQHPDVMAVTRCRICSKGMCETCDFLLPGNVHACPACLEKDQPTGLAPKRRNLMILGIAIAVFCTLLFGLGVTGALHSVFGNSEAANAIVGNLILWPAIAGVVVSLSALDRRLGNTAGIWVAVVWNSVNLGIFLILMVVGLASS